MSSIYPESSSKQREALYILTYIFLIIVSILSVFPLFWMITAATNQTVDVSRGKIWFGNYMVQNFNNLVNSSNLWKSFGNSLKYSVVQTLLCIFVCSLAGYGFELYHDKAKDILFAILLMAMMIPGVATRDQLSRRLCLRKRTACTRPCR